MTAKSYGRNSPRQFMCGKPKMSGCKLWPVCRVVTASFKRMVGMAIETAWLIYMQIHRTEALDLLDFKHAVHVPCLNFYTS
jgi:hypothetical protein